MIVSSVHEGLYFKNMWQIYRKLNQKNVFTIIFICFFTFLSLYWRFYRLGMAPGTNGDEFCGFIQFWEFFQGNPSHLWTLTGNLFSPLIEFPALFFQSFFTADFYWLRLPVALWGLATLALLYWIILKEFRSHLLAILWGLFFSFNLNLLSFSRFSWTPSLLPFFSLLMIYGCWKKSFLWALLGFGLSLTLHPVAIFLAPFFLMLIPPFWIKWKLPIKGGILLLFFGFYLFFIAISPMKLTPSVPTVLSRLVDGEFWRSVILSTLDLLSGAESAQYITGQEFIVTKTFLRLFLLATIIILGGSLYFHRKWFQERWENRIFIFGLTLFCSWFLFTLIASSQLLEMGNVRYGFFLLTPFYLFVILTFAPFYQRSNIKFFLLLLIVLQILLTYNLYWGAMWSKRGPLQHPCFVIGNEIEPKMELYQKLSEIKDGSKKTIVIVPDWWTYWPLRFLDYKERKFEVVIYQQAYSPLFPVDYLKALQQLLTIMAKGHNSAYEVYSIKYSQPSNNSSDDLSIIKDYWGIPFFSLSRFKF